MLMLNNLIGFGAGGDAALASIVQQASATSTAATLTAPADIVSGDLLIFSDLATNIGLPASVVPTGFTSLSSVSGGNNQRCITSYKIADGSEASATITGMDGNLSDRKVMVTFRGNVPFATASPNTWGGVNQITNPTAQTVTASGGTPPLIVFGVYGCADAAVDPRTFSTTKDGEVSQGTNLYVAWKIYMSSPADTDVDMDDEGGSFQNSLQSGYIALT